MARVIREVQPLLAFVENSPALTDRGLGRVLADLADMGMDAQWGVYGAGEFGFPHHRNRLWILAHAHGIRLEVSQVLGRFRPQSDALEILQALDGGSLRPARLDWKGYEQPALFRGDAGIPDWMEQHRAIGNSQNPIVAAAAYLGLGGPI